MCVASLIINIPQIFKSAHQKCTPRQNFLYKKKSDKAVRLVALSTPNGNEVEPFLLKIQKILFSKKCA